MDMVLKVFTIIAGSAALLSLEVLIYFFIKDLKKVSRVDRKAAKRAKEKAELAKRIQDLSKELQDLNSGK